MDLDDKIKNKSDQVSGKTKETVGKVTDNERLEAKGKLQHDKAELAEDFDDLKEKAKHAADDVKDAFKK